MATPPPIRISGLVKTYGPSRALDGMDLTVGAGEVHGSWVPTVPARPRPSASCSGCCGETPARWISSAATHGLTASRCTAASATCQET